MSPLNPKQTFGTLLTSSALKLTNHTYSPHYTKHLILTILYCLLTPVLLTLFTLTNIYIHTSTPRHLYTHTPHSHTHTPHSHMHTAISHTHAPYLQWDGLRCWGIRYFVMLQDFQDIILLLLYSTQEERSTSHPVTKNNYTTSAHSPAPR